MRLENILSCENKILKSESPLRASTSTESVSRPESQEAALPAIPGQDDRCPEVEPAAAGAIERTARNGRVADTSGCPETHAEERDDQIPVRGTDRTFLPHHQK